MSAQSLAVKDANNVTQNLSANTDPTNASALVGTTSITDPISGVKATVKPASTAAVAADSAAVVTLSPNTPLPAGSNAIGTVALNAPVPTGSNTIGNVGLVAGAAAIGSVTVSNFPATQTVAGNVTTTPPANASTNLTQAGGVAIAAQANNTAASNALPGLVGRFDTVLPTLVSGNVAAPQLDSSGRMLVGSIAGALPAGANALGSVSVSNFPATQAVSGTVALGAGTAAVGTVGVTSLPSIPAGANTIGAVSNIPANVDTAALITHSAASAGVAAADQTNPNGRGLQVGLNITAVSGTSPTIQVIVEGKDAASGTYYTLFASAAIAATVGFTSLSMYPGLTGSTTVGNQVLPRTWRVRTVIGGTIPSITATVGASVIV